MVTVTGRGVVPSNLYPTPESDQMQFFLTSDTLSELGVDPRYCQALSRHKCSASLLEYYTKMSMRMLKGTTADPIVAGLSNWILPELGYARHYVHLGKRYYNSTTIRMLAKEGSAADFKKIEAD